MKFDLKKEFETMECLEEAERSCLFCLLESRLEFIYGSAIGIAYLLDP